MELQEKKKNRTEQKTDMQNKEKALLTQLDEIAKQDLCLAFSGGVDSSLLLKLVMDASAKYASPNSAYCSCLLAAIIPREEFTTAPSPSSLKK